MNAFAPQEGVRYVERLLPDVQQVMRVTSSGPGDAEKGVKAEFRGRFIMEPEEAYELMEERFQQEGLIPLFRGEGSEQVVFAINRLPATQDSNPWIHLGLFILTLLTVLFAGITYSLGDPSIDMSKGLLNGAVQALPLGIQFAASLMGILLAHEFGHYFAARRHRMAVSLPFFIPLPIPFTFGTLGAFIRLKTPPKDKRALLDVGLSGPLAGMIVAIPVLLLGLSLSRVDVLPSDGTVLLEGNSILYMAMKYLIKGEFLPSPANYQGLPPVIYWIRYILIGFPIPIGGRDVILHPIAWAGWAGFLVTSLNLIPAGQLDGGHILYVLLGKRASRLWPFIVVGLLALGFIWFGWFIWVALLFFFGRVYARPLNELTPLNTTRKALAILGIILFFLVFTPVPFIQSTGGISP